MGGLVILGDEARGWWRQGLRRRGELELGFERRLTPQRGHIQKLGSQRRGNRVQIGHQFVSSAGVNGGIHHQRLGAPHVHSRGTFPHLHKSKLIPGQTTFENHNNKSLLCCNLTSISHCRMDTVPETTTSSRSAWAPREYHRRCSSFRSVQ